MAQEVVELLIKKEANDHGGPCRNQENVYSCKLISKYIETPPEFEFTDQGVDLKRVYNWEPHMYAIYRSLDHGSMTPLDLSCSIGHIGKIHGLDKHDLRLTLVSAKKTFI